MHLFIFEIFGFKVYGYGLVMVLTFFVCFFIASRYASANGLTQQDIYNFCLLSLSSLLFGPKIIGMIFKSDFQWESLMETMRFWKQGGFSFYPALLTSIFLIFTYCRVKKISFFKTLDFLFPIAIFGIGIQRIFGCFLAGCCYGKPTDLPWGVVFPKGCHADLQYPGIPLHPTQLYYGISALIIAFFLWCIRKIKLKQGLLTAWGFIFLGVSYFGITFLRGDIPEDQFYYSLSLSQYLSLGLALLGVIFFLSLNGEFIVGEKRAKLFGER